MNDVMCLFDVLVEKLQVTERRICTIGTVLPESSGLFSRVSNGWMKSEAFGNGHIMAEDDTESV